MLPMTTRWRTAAGLIQLQPFGAAIEQKPAHKRRYFSGNPLEDRIKTALQ
jgi:hypothetical protein